MKYGERQATNPMNWLFSATEQGGAVMLFAGAGVGFLIWAATFILPDWFFEPDAGDDDLDDWIW